MWGLVVALGLVAVAALAPFLTPYHPLRGSGPALSPPTLAHPFGTDDLGRDVLSGVLYGSRTSLLVGFSASLISLVIGVVVGAPAGFFGGVVDDLLTRFTELFQVIPRIFLAILLVALFGQTLTVTIVAIGALSWPPSARLLRAEFLSKRGAEYVVAARTVGVRTFRIITRHLLPNSLAPVVVSASLNVGGAILLEAGLAFLGLSDPNQVSLGRTLQAAMQFIHTAWWISVFPGLTVAILVVAVNLVGDGINDALNPRRSN
jgi:peptide/nickel transport system permease protein